MMTDAVAGVLLAGGRSRRMGGTDKMLIDVAGQSLLQRVITRARPQVSAMLLNANGDPARFSSVDLPIRADVIDGYAGPLAGILTGMEWVKETRPEIRWLVSLATDTPMLPEDLVSRLLATVTGEGADIAIARSGQFDHPVFGLWPVRLAGDLRRALIEENVRKLALWCARYQVARVVWPDGDADPFFNINTPEDIARFRQMTPADDSSSE